MQTYEDRARRRSAGRLKRVIPAVVLAGLALIAVSACGGDDDSTTETTLGGGGVELPQDPSLRMFLEADAVYVENDGNVTMSDVEVRDGSGDVLCDVGTLSPDDREPCDEADGVDDVTAFGVGPQGQKVQVGLADAE